MAEINNNAKTGQERQCPAGYKICDGYIIPNEWSVVCFNSLFKRLTRKNTENNQNVLTISARQGLVSQMDYYNTLYASENKEGYSLLQKGDFSYNKSYSSDYAYGVIKRLDAYDSGIVSPLYICFTPKDGTNSDFYLQYFEAGRFNREIYKIAQEGARNHGLLNVSTEDFFNSSLVFPPLAEQERIAGILMQCDKVIELKRKRFAEERKKKKWLISKLLVLPHKAQKLGAICTIGDVAEVVGRIGFRGYTKEDLVHSEEGAISMSPSNMNNGEVDFSLGSYISWKKYNESPEIMLQKDDILFVKTGSTYGKCAQVRVLSEPATINPQLAIIRASKVNPDYLLKVLESDIVQKRVKQIVVGGAVPTLTQEEIRDFEISIPSPAEQYKISVLLLQQDELIKKLNDEVCLLQNKKKALMQLLLTGIVRTNV